MYFPTTDKIQALKLLAPVPRSITESTQILCAGQRSKVVVFFNFPKLGQENSVKQVNKFELPNHQLAILCNKLEDECLLICLLVCLCLLR